MQLTENNKLSFILYKLKEAYQELKQSDVKKKNQLKKAYEESVIFYKSRESDILKLKILRIKEFDFKYYLCQQYRKIEEEKNSEKIKKVEEYLKKQNK